MTKVCYETISNMASRLEKKEISPVELTKVILDRIREVDEHLVSYLTVMENEAMAEAEKAESEIMKGNYRGPLHGIPLALKDLIYTKGTRTTSGSKLLESFIPDYDATVVKKLREAGAIITGKLNMHEFAFGVTNRNEHFGDAKNPWDTKRITGGSSGGSGAAVAAGLCFASIGSDTGGSIRIPSALCGIYGLKPTFGRVSKYGAIPLSWSLDHLGPMARSVQDLAIVMEAIAGFDANDPTTVKKEVPSYSALLHNGIKDLRIGVPVNFFFDLLEPSVKESVEKAIQELEDLGASLVEIEIPELELALFSELITIRSEAAAYHHDNLVKNQNLFGKDVRISLQAGELVTAVQYVKAQQARRKIQEAITKQFKRVDVIAAPALSMTAPEIGESFKKINGEKIAFASEFVKFAAPANLTGIPAIAMPTGLSSEGLPMAIQIMGKPFDEATLLRVAAAYEREVPFEHFPIP